MENERLRITLDKEDKVYFAGQTLKGEIWLNLAKRTKIRAIKVQITGKGKCKWMEILRKSSNNETSSRSLFYSSKEVYAQCENPLSVFEPRGLELSPGEHTFEFTMQLDWNLPSSFKGSYGSIKYKMRILIQRPWSFDQRHTIPMTVVKYMPLPPCYRANPTSLEKQITKTISLFGTRPITMLALLPEDFALRGEPLRICVTVTNNSTTNVEKLRFIIFQYVWYYSHVPLRIQKMECVAIASKETGAVHKKSERSFAHELMVPEGTQPSDDELSGVINISYELRVEAVLRGFFKNLVLNLPFKVYSNEVDVNCGGGGGVRPMPPLPPAPQQSIYRPPSAAMSEAGPGNPFETLPRPPLPVYPSLDSSIGSPSHSSVYSESSSMRSITSDSSAATLSPAMAGASNDLSQVSGSSSLYNSPSARASLRSSNVPYMPYSSSPMMVNSYPPAGAQVPYYPNSALNDSLPQYTLMVSPATPRVTPTPPLSQSAAAAATSYVPTSASSYLRSRQPAEAHELPPSYEELFGNASAPPGMSK